MFYVLTFIFLIEIREHFLPYLSNSFEAMSKLLKEDDEDIIDSALEAYGQLCINFSKLSDSSGQISKFILKINFLSIEIFKFKSNSHIFIFPFNFCIYQTFIYYFKLFVIMWIKFI